MIELTFNAYSLLITVAAIIGMTFGLLLLLPGINNKANRFLAAVLLIVVGWNGSLLILDLFLYRYAAGVIWIPMKFTLALGPCFYIYTRLISDYELKQNLKIWPHFIPVCFEVFLYLIQVYQAIPLGIGYFQTATFQRLDPVVNMLAICSLMVYGYCARQRIKSYHHWVKDNFSHYHRYQLNWLYRFSLVFIVFWVVWLVYFIVDFGFYDYQLTFADYYPFHLTLAVISIWLSVEAFTKPTIEYPEITVSEKDQTFDVADEELKQQAQWLNNQIADNLLYLDPELSLRSLAGFLDIHPNLLSKLINDGMNQTFSDCINAFRVDAVVQKLRDKDNHQQTLLAIALDCGFNSKSTFNRVFKKVIGKTPLQYRDQLHKS